MLTAVFRRLTQVTPGKCWDNASNTGAAASLNILSNSLFINSHPIVGFVQCE
jgi:hypothetical protein